MNAGHPVDDTDVYGTGIGCRLYEETRVILLVRLWLAERIPWVAVSARLLDHQLSGQLAQQGLRGAKRRKVPMYTDQSIQKGHSVLPIGGKLQR